ncbi:hypothetical protein NFI96_006637 [Prochilodus magdalenae]|nr:hypothetical protein NFI96_006637 [Prochilodus magdalenae]
MSYGQMRQKLNFLARHISSMFTDRKMKQAVCQQQGDEEEEESLYANKSMLSPQQPLSGNNPDLLHYSIIYFPNGKDGSGEIRGLSSLTADYATILYSSSKNPERETTEEDNTVTEEEIPQLIKEEATYGEYHLSQDLSVRI